jgi:hypothetical protein
MWLIWVVVGILLPDEVPLWGTVNTSLGVYHGSKHLCGQELVDDVVALEVKIGTDTDCHLLCPYHAPAERQVYWLRFDVHGYLRAYVTAPDGVTPTLEAVTRLYESGAKCPDKVPFAAAPPNPDHIEVSPKFLGQLADHQVVLKDLIDPTHGVVVGAQRLCGADAARALDAWSQAADAPLKKALAQRDDAFCVGLECHFGAGAPGEAAGKLRFFATDQGPRLERVDTRQEVGLSPIDREQLDVQDAITDEHYWAAPDCPK